MAIGCAEDEMRAAAAAECRPQWINYRWTCQFGCYSTYVGGRGSTARLFLDRRQ